MAYLVCTLPGRGFLVCENLIAASIPPSMDFVAMRQIGHRLAGVRAIGTQDAFMFGQRMAGEIVAQHLRSSVS